MLRIINIAAFIAALSIICANVMAFEQFQLKGVFLGMTPSQACNNAQVTSEFESSIRVLKNSVPGLVEMDTKECNVPTSVFAKSVPSKPASLLFQKNKLILYKLEFEKLDLNEMVQILEGLKQQYGPSQRTKKYGLVIDTWRQNGQILELTRDGSDMEIFLTDVVGMKYFNDISKANGDRIKKADQKNIQTNMR